MSLGKVIASGNTVQSRWRHLSGPPLMANDTSSCLSVTVVQSRSVAVDAEQISPLAQSETRPAELGLAGGPHVGQLMLYLLWQPPNCKWQAVALLWSNVTYCSCDLDLLSWYIESVKCAFRLFQLHLQGTNEWFWFYMVALERCFTITVLKSEDN